MVTDYERDRIIHKIISRWKITGRTGRTKPRNRVHADKIALAIALKRK